MQVCVCVFTHCVSQVNLHTVDGCEILHQLVDSMVYPTIIPTFTVPSIVLSMYYPYIVHRSILSIDYRWIIHNILSISIYIISISPPYCWLKTRSNPSSAPRHGLRRGFPNAARGSRSLSAWLRRRRPGSLGDGADQLRQFGGFLKWGIPNWMVEKKRKSHWNWWFRGIYGKPNWGAE